MNQLNAWVAQFLHTYIYIYIFTLYIYTHSYFSIYFKN